MQNQADFMDEQKQSSEVLNATSLLIGFLRNAFNAANGSSCKRKWPTKAMQRFALSRRRESESEIQLQLHSDHMQSLVSTHQSCC